MRTLKPIKRAAGHLRLRLSGDKKYWSDKIMSLHFTRTSYYMCYILSNIKLCYVTGWLWQPHVATQHILNINLSINQESYTSVTCEVEATVYSSLWINRVNFL
jgi:hypothetical protein